MTQAPVAPAKTRAQISERTLRKDPWWRAPRITASPLTIWTDCATVHAFIGKWYCVAPDHVLTPFYTPCVSGEQVSGSALVETWMPRLPPIIHRPFVSLLH